MAVFDYNPIGRRMLDEARITPEIPEHFETGVALRGVPIQLWEVQLKGGFCAVVPATEEGHILDRFSLTVADSGNEKVIQNFLNKARGKELTNGFKVDWVEYGRGFVKTGASKSLGEQDIEYALIFPVAYGLPGEASLSLKGEDYQVLVEDSQDSGLWIPRRGDVGGPSARFVGKREDVYFQFAGEDGYAYGLFRPIFHIPGASQTNGTLLPPLPWERDSEGFLEKAHKEASKGFGISYQGTARAIILGTSLDKPICPEDLAFCKPHNQTVGYQNPGDIK